MVSDQFSTQLFVVLNHLVKDVDCLLNYGTCLKLVC